MSNYKPDYWQTVPGWFDWMDLYDEVALTTPPGSLVVEVGVAFGRSLLYLAQRIKETGKDIQVVAVDRWQPYPEHHFIYQEDAPIVESERVAYECAKRHGGVFPAFCYHLYESGLADWVNVVRADSVKAARMFENWAQNIYDGHPTKQPHFVFIDAEHEAQAVDLDLHAWWDEVKPEWAAGHDYNRGSDIHFPGVWKTVDAKFGQENVEWRGQTCWVVRRSHLERTSEVNSMVV
ncbi:MAG TPA: class I SAM-dependent methyltransferase [Candidatus Sulfotelmatobacter sp.]|nr:class I SAM-dependent methyltransferase [Candidatus Sulfotelmatobacter sp.]